MVRPPGAMPPCMAGPQPPRNGGQSHNLAHKPWVSGRGVCRRSRSTALGTDHRLAVCEQEHAASERWLKVSFCRRAAPAAQRTPGLPSSRPNSEWTRIIDTNGPARSLRQLRKRKGSVPALRRDQQCIANGSLVTVRLARSCFGMSRVASPPPGRNVRGCASNARRGPVRRFA